MRFACILLPLITGTAYAQGIYAHFDSSIIPMLVILLVMTYILLIRPQNQKEARYRKTQAALEVTQTIQLTCGIFGVVKKIQHNMLHVEIAPNTILQVDKTAVLSIIPSENQE